MTKYTIFTDEMKKDYTVLVPTMLPMHFSMIVEILRNAGYHAELLENTGSGVIERGLRYVHNDTCYPAQLVIGQMMDAIESGKYDTHKIALLISQTGGGCRASNYLALIRKALEKAGLEYIPVLSLNFSGLEKDSSLKFTVPIAISAVYAILYGDLLMSLRNQCRPYEKEAGAAEALARRLTKELTEEMMTKGGLSYRRVKKNYRRILRAFKALPLDEEKRKTTVRVGIVGEIFVKFSPLGNNGLEDFLVSEGAEPVLPGLLDFVLYCVYNSIMDKKLYGIGKAKGAVYSVVFNFLCKKQKELIDIIKEESDFMPPTPFRHTISLTEGVISLGVKMGEGWLLTAEMLELADSGVENIVCTQPFGCLPNHIVGKGMMRPIKERFPQVNIVAVDYDAGATQINQENRIKLMLANARERLRSEEETIPAEAADTQAVNAAEEAEEKELAGVG